MIRSTLTSVLALAIAGSAWAANAQEVRTKHVSYAGLDLNSAAGVSILQRRIHFALRDVCDPQMPDTLGAAAARHRCMIAAQPSIDRQLAAIGLAPTRSVSVVVAAR